MNGRAKTELLLDGLCCANCAAKIEEKVKAIEGVVFASLNFVSKTLTIEADDVAKMENIIQTAKQIVRKIEPEVVVREKIMTKSPRKVLILMGLDCAHCAAKIEEQVKNLKGVIDASVDLLSRKLTIEVANKADFPFIMEQVKQIVQKTEPHVEILEEGEQGAPSSAASNLWNKDRKKLWQLTAGALLFAVGFLAKLSFWPRFVLYLAGYLAVGGEILLRAVKNIARGQVFDENFLMTVATVGAFAIGEFPEGVAVMLFYQIGEFLQDLAVDRSRRSIKALLDIRPDYANLQVGNDIKRVSPEEVRVGELIIVKPGERIPLDGKVVDGRSMVDTSALTGESVPRVVEAGSEVLAGFINQSGLLTVEVTKEFAQSTVAKILDLVQNASSKKAPTENFITKFARVYTPAVVFTAFALAVFPPLFIQGATFSEWVYRALIFLVISCPCALVVSIPLGFFGGIGGASKRGILIKGGNFLEGLNQVNTVVFDKTGTLTKGVFKVTAVNPAPSFTKEEVLECAALAESYSNHPIAVSVREAYQKEINPDEIERYNEIAGRGIKVFARGKEILAGNAKLLAAENIAAPEPNELGTIVHIAVNGQYAGHLVISDEIKEDAPAALAALRKMGIKKLVMLTGDNRTAGAKVAEQLGMDEVFAELLPDQKVEKLEMLVRQKVAGGKLVFVGDGINDAPVLARADIGVAMGGVGSDAAIEAADVVLMTDEPSKLGEAIKIAKRTRQIVWQNIVFALGAKALVLLMGAFGMATMWEAVFADVGVALIAVLNATRVMNVKGL